MLNKAIKTIKKVVGISEDKSPKENDRQISTYWINCIKRAEKAQPTAEWLAAMNRLKCKEGSGEEGRGGNEEPYVNGFRLHYESLKAFLDQRNAEFNVTPTEPFLTNPTIIKQAECDLAYLTYVWDEQKCQPVSSQMLDSAIIRNLGCTLPGFDKKKWMPNLQYVSAKNILFDPDCNGVREKAGWEGYKETVSVEELLSKAPELTEDEIEKIKREAGSLLTDEEQTEYDIKDPDKTAFSVVTLYHIFARNDVAIRKFTEEEKMPDKEKVKVLNLTTPKRYLQFVKGLERPLVNTEGWPYELDDNEFPTTVLKFNKPVEDSFGFTDNIQMKRLDIAFDNIMHDLVDSAYWEGNKKFGGTGESGDLTEADVEKFLRDPKKWYLPKIIGSDGNPKIKWIDTGKFSPELVEALKVVDEQRDKASAIGEILSTQAAEWKDVRAISARIHDANVHQKINRRLSEYELTIAENAVKMLEIAHQFVPRYSLLEVPVPKWTLDEGGNPVETGETYMDYQSFPWEQVQVLMSRPNVTLIMLGADAIVGPELAPYWRTAEEYSPQLFKLSTTIQVVPGSTRSITKEHRAAMLKEYYNEIFFPLYQLMGRWDLARNFLGHISTLIDLGDGKDFIPDLQSTQQFNQQWQQMQMQAQMEGGKGKA